MQQLTSTDATVAAKAVADIMDIGEPASKYLFQLRGDRRPFRGGPLGDPQGAQFSLDAFDDAAAVTNEGAALYLINAIYYDTLSFAQSALLVDTRVPQGERVARNTRELLDLGWAAALRWRERLDEIGMSEARRRRIHPLSDSPVAFW